MNKLTNTLFLLQSLDWKINPWNDGDLWIFSQWKDFAKIKWLQEWIMQYYELEQNTDLHSLNTGKVMKTIWINDEKSNFSIYWEVSFIIIDSKHLTEVWVNKLASNLKKLYIITTNKNHPVFEIKRDFQNIEILFYEEKINFKDMMNKLEKVYKIKNITLQSGWTLNSELFKNNLINKLSIVIAPVIIGGKDTPTLVDWKSITKIEELHKLKVLKLNKINKLKNSYIHLEYDVLDKIEINKWFDVPN